MDLGKNLYNLRKNKNLSQEEVAEKLNVTRQTISKWETNESKPDFDKILPICELFNITTEELLIGINTEKQELNETINNKNTDSEIIKKRAIFISIGTFLYFLSLVLIICTEEINISPIIGVSGFFLICGVATSLIVYQAIVYSKKQIKEEKKESRKAKLITETIAIIFLIIYLLISFITFAWHITWIIWLIYAIIENIIKIIFEMGDDQNGK
ncbi:MAG: helix-turn-helix transcriptional regulator [Bacilli bacterium]|nr:helix-turn-helix transcriptional regulator [Bacilli bacterium]